MWVILKADMAIWVVGFFDPRGNWVPFKDCKSEETATRWVHYLNGGDWTEL